MNNSLIIAGFFIRRMLGSRKALLSRIIIPVAVISAIIGITASMGAENIRIIYYNADQGQLGKHVVTGLQGKQGFTVEPVDSMEEVKRQIVAHQASGALVIPQDFSAVLWEGKLPDVELFELTQTKSTVMLRQYSDAEISRVQQAIVQTRAADAAIGQDHQALLERLLTQQEQSAIKTNVDPGHYNLNPYFNTIIGLMLMFLLMMSSGGIHIIMEDRVNRTMQRVYSAPVRAWEITLGNFLGNAAIGTIQISVTLLFTRYVIGYDYNGIPLWALFLVLECFLLAAIGMASAIAGTVRDTKSLGQVNNILVTPTCMLGGCFWPLAIMPDFMQKIANFVPQKWAIDAAMKLADGEHLMAVASNLGILLLFAVLLLSIGASILRPAQKAL